MISPTSPRRVEEMTSTTDTSALREAAEKATPIAYAYRYPIPFGGTVLRLDTGGREINGARPIETIPLYGPEVLSERDALAERVRTLETAVLDVTISDRLDEAGSPLTWQEVAEEQRFVVALMAACADERYIGKDRGRWVRSDRFDEVREMLDETVRIANMNHLAWRQSESRAREAEAKVQALTEGLEAVLDGVTEMHDRRGSSLGFKLADVGAGSYQALEALLHPTPSEQGGEHG